MDNLRERWEMIQKKIQSSCRRVGRDPREIQVIAVTKYSDLNQTQQILDFGVDHMGESRVQDAIPKVEIIGDRGTWHFIGHLQKNKVKYMVDSFDYLHSLDRYSLAKELQRRASQLGKTMRCFLQVNISGEKTKFGISPRELDDFAMEIANMSSIEIVGLMTMAPRVDNPEETRPIFRELKRLQTQLQKKNLPTLRVPHLSMGMSQDFEIAIEEGATWIRLGSILVK